MRTRYLFGVIASVGVAMALIVAPNAAADPNETSNQTPCTSVDGGTSTGTNLTTCQTPGNVQITAGAPDVPTSLYPWDDDFWGPALIIGGNGGGIHGGGGSHGGGHH
jgi:hypothetical protein